MFSICNNIKSDNHNYLKKVIERLNSVEEELKNIQTSNPANTSVKNTSTKYIDSIANHEKRLVDIAQQEPQLAYSAYVFGTSKRWQFVCRTTPGISKALQPLEDAIHQKFIPALFEGKFISEDFRKVLSLPARLGGLGILNPVEEAILSKVYLSIP